MIRGQREAVTRGVAARRRDAERAVPDTASNPCEVRVATVKPTGPFFTGEFDLTVDEKGRLLIPSSVRNQLDEERDGLSLIIVIGQNGKHWFYPETYYKQEVAPVTNDPVPDTDMLNYMMLVFSSARPVTPDKQGRIVLPDDDSFDRESLGRNVTLIGLRNHLQLWPRDEWIEHKKTLKARSGELAERYRQFQQRNKAAAEAAARQA